MQVGDVMKKNIITAPDTATFYDVLKKMIRHKTNVILIVNMQNRLVGMVDAFELIREMLPDYVEEDSVAAHFATEDIFHDDCERVRNVPVTQFMEKELVTITMQTSLTEAAVIALTKKSERIPVVDDKNEPIGLLTRTEIKQVIGKHLGIKESFSWEEEGAQ